MDSELPESVQRIVDGVGAGDARCGKCRQPAKLRCTRCQVTKYCSASCQKDHFAHHKRDCKKIGMNRKLAEINWDHAPNEATKIKTTIEFVDLLLKVGYRESDTIENGSLYFREALREYLKLLPLVEKETHHMFDFIQDRILLLLVVLGGDDGTIQAMGFEYGVGRLVNCWLPADQFDFSDIGSGEGGDASDAPDFEMAGYAHPEETGFQFLMMLSLMKLMATYRRAQEGLSVYNEVMQTASAVTDLGKDIMSEDIFDHISSYLMGEKHEGKVELEVLPGRIQNVVSAIRYHGKESYLVHLRDSIPYTSAHAPRLFTGVELEGEEPHQREAPPRELWMIFQDCFFETPGLNDVLREFVPEEV